MNKIKILERIEYQMTDIQKIETAEMELKQKLIYMLLYRYKNIYRCLKSAKTLPECKSILRLNYAYRGICMFIRANFFAFDIFNPFEFFKWIPKHQNMGTKWFAYPNDLSSKNLILESIAFRIQILEDEFKLEDDKFCYKIYKDSEQINQFDNQSNDLCVFKFLHKDQSQSISYALEHEGYVVDIICNNTGKLTNYK